GIPAFSIYGHDVQDADDTSIPADVEEKLLRFARAGLAVASMKVYKSSFTAMYTAVTTHRQPCRMKLVRVGPEEKIVGIHGIG
ncbi:hypothetical protein MJN51_41280, partial [Salmonella enterica subsp. enterica serovar Kentucky]|nr:hypothetical protein [Salmonella enterica subsp. enterica serovar Kentucky]